MSAACHICDGLGHVPGLSGLCYLCKGSGGWNEIDGINPGLPEARNLESPGRYAAENAKVAALADQVRARFSKGWLS